MEVGSRSEGAVGRIQLSSGGRSEIVLSTAGLASLLDAIAHASGDPACRAIVLEGEPGCFCRGMDLGEVSSGADADGGLATYGAVLRALHDAPQIVIAAVDGAVMAGGVGLAAVADVAIATARSEFGLAEVMLGLVPGMVLPTLAERMPLQRVRRFATQVASVDGVEAQRIGLIDTVVDDGTALEKAVRRELKNVLRAHPQAVASVKKLCAALGPEAFDQAVTRGGKATRARLAAEGTVDAITRFVDGEPLPWFDRYRP